MTLKTKAMENTVGKGEIARNEQFLLFPQCFLPVWRALCSFQQISHMTGFRLSQISNICRQYMIGINLF